jgi:thiol-disulfide isomerase/thioredoxin
MNDTSGFSQSSEMERQMLPADRPARLVWPWLLVAAALAVILVWRAMGGAGKAPPAASHPAIGTKITTFRLEPLTGDGRSITESDLVGKVTLVNFWGPWCGACRIEFPHLVEIEQHFRGQPDFQFFSVSSNFDPFDEQGLQQSTEQFLKQFQADFPTHRDPEAKTTIALIKAARIEGFGYPTTVLLDREGVIRGLWPGFSPGDERQIRQAIDAALKAPTSPAG